jgi:hypothetical protein
MRTSFGALCNLELGERVPASLPKDNITILYQERRKQVGGEVDGHGRGDGDSKAATIAIDQFEMDGDGAVTACPCGWKAMTTFEDVGEWC